MSLIAEGLLARRGEFALQIDHWEVVAGECQALLGANGAGKSSMFSALAGDLAYQGDIRLQGRSVRAWTAGSRARRLGVLPQQSQMPFAFTAEEVVALGLTPLSVGWREGKAQLRHCMARCECAHLAARSYLALSGGERQRVNLARVLLQLSEAESSPVLLLDEPTSAQDLGHQHGMLAMIRNLAHIDNYAVVVVLHDLNHALRYADRCVLLDDGKLVANGRPDNVLDANNVEHFWGYRPQRATVGDHAVLL